MSERRIPDVELRNFDHIASIELDRETIAFDADPIASIIGRHSDLRPWTTSEGVRWIVQGLVAEGGLTLLSSTGGGGKSLLLLDLIVRLAAGTGELWLDAYRLPDRPLRVCYIESENGVRRIRRRLRELVLGEAFDGETVDRALAHIRSYHASDIRQPELVLSSVGEIHAREQADVYVIDPLKDFFPRETDDINKQIQVARALAPLIAFVQAHGRAVLLTDHDTKGAVAASGSHVKRDTVEQLVHLTAPDAEDPHYLELAILKDRDFSGAPRRIALERVCGEPVRTSSDDDVTLYPVRFERASIRETKAKVSSASDRRDSALELIEQHYSELGMGLSINGLKERLGCSRASAERDIKELISRGLAYRPDPRGPVYPARAKAAL